jgi:hypothetical protein
MNVDVHLKGEATKSFVGVVADAIDGVQFGKKVGAGGTCGSHRSETKRDWMSLQLRRINDAIGAARNFGVLSEFVVKFSNEELYDLQNEIRDYRKLELQPKIKKRILDLLRERLVHDEILSEISTLADVIATEVKAGTWVPH